MYGDKNIDRVTPMPKEPEHYDIAKKMAQEIIERFEPTEQNECLNIIHAQIKDARTMQLAEANDRVTYLTKSLENL